MTPQCLASLSKEFNFFYKCLYLPLYIRRVFYDGIWIRHASWKINADSMPVISNDHTVQASSNYRNHVSRKLSHFRGTFPVTWPEKKETRDSKESPEEKETVSQTEEPAMIFET